MSEHNDMYIYWFEHWSKVDFAENLFDERTIDELVEEYGEDKMKYAKKHGWLTFYAGGHVIPDITRYKYETEKGQKDPDAYVELYFDGETMAQASKMLKAEEAYKPDLESVNDLYGSPDDDSDESDEEEAVQTPKRCPPAPKKAKVSKMSERLEMYKFWFKHWSDIDFQDDVFDEQTVEELTEEYGMEKMKYAAKQEWLSFYYGGGVLDDIAAFECPEDETGIVEIHFNGETMAQASKMLKAEEAYKPDLESVNDLYGTPYDDCDDSDEEVQTPKRCPPAPKKGLKRQRSDSGWEEDKHVLKRASV